MKKTESSPWFMGMRRNNTVVQIHLNDDRVLVMKDLYKRNKVSLRDLSLLTGFTTETVANVLNSK